MYDLTAKLWPFKMPEIENEEVCHFLAMGSLHMVAVSYFLFHYLYAQLYKENCTILWICWSVSTE